MTREEYGAAYQKHFSFTVNLLCRRKGLGRDYAEEISQTAWVRGWERLYQLRNAEMLTTWVNSIALHELASQVRKKQTYLELPNNLVAPNNVTDLRYLDAMKVIRTFKSNKRKILELYYVEGWKSEEIAEKYEVSAITIRNWLYRQRKIIIQKLSIIPPFAHGNGPNFFKDNTL